MEDDHRDRVRRFLEDNSILKDITDDDLIIIAQAFTTSGYANEHLCPNNERLEFLGNAVIRAYVSRRVYDSFPRMCEG